MGEGEGGGILSYVYSIDVLRRVTFWVKNLVMDFLVNDLYNFVLGSGNYVLGLKYGRK